MRLRGILCAALAIMVVAGAARADTPPARGRSTRTRAVPDASILAAKGQDVQVDIVNGDMRGGKLVGFDEETVTLVIAANGDETRISRGLVARLYLVHIPEPLPPSPAPAAPTATPAGPGAMLRRVVALELAGGRERSGILVRFDAESVTIIDRLNGEIITFARTSLTGMREGAIHDAYHPTPPPAPPPPPSARPPEPRPDDRHLGVHFALLPAVMVDYERGLFYGYASADAAVLVYGAAKGQSSFLGAAGAGVLLRPSRSSRLRVDITAHVIPVRYFEVTSTASSGSDSGVHYPTYLGVGAGVGVHYTFPRGLSLGAKLPGVGYMIPIGGGADRVGPGEAIARHYLAALLALPVLSVGYRF